MDIKTLVKSLPITQLLIAMIVVLAFIIIVKLTTNTTIIKSSFDGENYNVIGCFDNSKEAADLMAKVNSIILDFLNYLKNKYEINKVSSINDNMRGVSFGGSAGARTMKNTQMIIERILTNYNPEVIYENQPTGKDGTSYTLDKGSKLVLCLRDKKTKQLHDIDILVFVALHEVAHMGNETWGHDDKFWQTFKFLLNEAKLAGIHNPKDYALHPVVYCGLPIDYNPFYDPSIKNI